MAQHALRRVDKSLAVHGVAAWEILLPVLFAGGYMAIAPINLMLVVFTGPKIAADPRGFSEENVSVGTSLVYLGWAMSSLLVMPLSDKVGRKPILYLMNTIGLISVACSLAATGPWLYMISLFGTGFFSSASILGFVLCQELIPERLRPAAYSSLSVCFGLVLILLALTSTRLTCAWSWRLETAVWYIPHLLLTICGPSAIYESPAFRKDTASPCAESEGIEDGSSKPTATGLCRDEGAGASAAARLTSKALMGRVCATCFNWSATVVGYYGLSYSAGNFSDDVCLSTILFALGDICVYIVAAPIVATLGAKRVQALAFTGAGLILSTLSLLPPDSPWVLAGVVGGRCCINLDFFTINMLVIEHFPTECCTTAFGWANFTSRVAGMAAPMCSLMPTAMTFRFIGALTIAAAFSTRSLPDPPDASHPATPAEGPQQLRALRKGRARYTLCTEAK